MRSNCSGRLDVERIAADADLVVFHSMVRIHVPRERRDAFDAAIAGSPAGAGCSTSRSSTATKGPALLSLADSEGEDVVLARVHGHGRWLAPGAGMVGRAWGTSASGSSAMDSRGGSSTDR